MLNIKTDKIQNSICVSIVLGIVFGSLCALLDLLPYNNIWTFSSFSGSLGFWAVTGMIVLMQYEKYWKSAVGTFVYFSFMNASFFIVQFLMSPMIEYPRISELSEALLESAIWMLPSAVCGACALIAYNAKKDNIVGIIALSLPIGLLAYEVICLFFSVLFNHKYLFQTIVDILGIVLLWCLYSKEKKKILLLIIITIVVAVLLLLTYIFNGTILYF